MSTNEKISQILTKVLGASIDLDLARQGDIPEWDSLASLSIMFEVEETFGIELSEQEVSNLSSLNSIVEIVESHLS